MKRVYTKKINLVIILIILCILILFFFYEYRASLTKDKIFDIINSIEEVAITCIATDGVKSLSDENKLDITVLYIIENIEYYKDEIIKMDVDNKDLETIIFGKIEKSKFSNIYSELFSDNIVISDYKYYDGEYVVLCFEPSNYYDFDTKEIEEYKNNGSYYSIIVKYNRTLYNVSNDVYIKYILDYDLKIQDITIMSSNI